MSGSETIEQLAGDIVGNFVGGIYLSACTREAAEKIERFLASHEGHVVRDGRLVPLEEKEATVSQQPPSPYSREEVAEALKQLDAEGVSCKRHPDQHFSYMIGWSTYKNLSSESIHLLAQEADRLKVPRQEHWKVGRDLIASAHNLPTLAEQEKGEGGYVYHSDKEMGMLSCTPADPAVTDADRELAKDIIALCECQSALGRIPTFGAVLEHVARSRHDERQRWEAEREKLQEDRVEAWLERDALRSRLNEAEHRMAQHRFAARRCLAILEGTTTPAASAERTEG